ncbi:helix-turn-helix domain-containing protein [Clostridium magnum]|uniref:Helix-turn-helix protein n=1 Tax=Clostridium magnum DSM 2767 TaxID=1121326 RepID=A0A161WQL2_9CLOT|nr:helix-turn-helix transcriptional regulator [Clostridium magnum]KZL88938.1 helix-turn-helix protein [Clostridium magnum DSM 2767]SHI54319.1 Helix-turn-helix [Clostridium magnum DSM 2767]
MENRALSDEQLQIIEDAIKDVSEREKLIEYLGRHDVVGKEIFAYLNITRAEIWDVIYEPVSYDVFIKRIPIYFYHSDGQKGSVGNFSQYAMGIYEYYADDTEYTENLEKLYMAVERMHYQHMLDLKTIFNYPIEQTGYCSRTDLFMQWANYLDLAGKYGVSNKTPKYFIVEYNYILERAGLKPIIYEIKEQYSGEYMSRTGNVIRVEGTFPFDDNGNPIMKWIGLDVIEPTRIWGKVDDRSKGYICIEVNSKTAIYGLNCWGSNDNGEDCWHRLYVGPLLIEFDYKKLKECRNRENLTQKQVAAAIGSAERTYQKWESGETTPDCIYLLRLMNVLNIKEVDELTSVSIE